MSGLATRLARQDPAPAVRRFAAATTDPSGDLVASVLLLAMSRSCRTADVLSELAVTIRDRASMRLPVDAERAGQRGEARFVVGFGAVVITAVIVFGQSTTFLDAYDSATDVGESAPWPRPAPDLRGRCGSWIGGRWPPTANNQGPAAR